MSDISPSRGLRRSKRQKTKDTRPSSSMKAPSVFTKPRSKKIAKQTTPPVPSNMVWPQGVDDNGVGTPLLPVEIYESIARYLSRADVQNMRLVSHEFDRNICQVLFKVVVVPFRSEIYGIAPDTENALLSNSFRLQDEGMRVFQGFGPWIRRFAMSFEIDMERLEDPPAKAEQEYIKTFWGTYAWPHQTYNRFTALEGLEQIADETKSMAKALRYIDGASELGLSIDGGLGFLSGPDINTNVNARGKKPSVFGASKFVPAGPARKQRKDKAISALGGGSWADLEKILTDAGYSGETLQAASDVLMAQIVPPPSASFQPATNLVTTRRAAPPQASGLSLLPRIMENTFNALTGRPARSVDSETANGITDRLESLDTNSVASDEDDLFANPVTTTWADAQAPHGNQAPNGVHASTGHQTLTSSQIVSLALAKQKKEKDGVTIKPNSLTTPQKEMLLEMEWAQNAFMQSWVIAIIDNASTFANIKKLTVARLPKRHLNILSRKDFWDSLPNLQGFSLAVIPDWREIQKDETAWVQECAVAPSASVVAVFQLLTEHIAHRKNITNLHFEWLCGGEYAPGIFSRNQLLLPAPVVADAIHMVNRTLDYPVLVLPHVKHLSFKNCWFTPHVLHKFVWLLKKEVLESISFNSVSLSAPMPRGALPTFLNLCSTSNNGQSILNAVQTHGNHHLGLQAQQAQAQAAAAGPLAAPVAAPPQPPPALPVVNGPDWLQHPRQGSWAEFIETFTPGKTLAEHRYNQNIGSELEPRTPSRLRKLSFTSCGYIHLPLDVDQTWLGAEDFTSNPQQKRINELDASMMKASDHLFGVISSHMPVSEVAALENAWGCIVGWRKSRPEFAEWAELAEDAKLDGVVNAGKARFQGVIEISSDSPNVLI